MSENEVTGSVNPLMVILIILLILLSCKFTYDEMQPDFRYKSNVSLSEAEVYSICNKNNHGAIYSFGYDDQNPTSDYSGHAVIRCSFFNYQKVDGQPLIVLRALNNTDSSYEKNVILSKIFDYPLEVNMDVKLSLSITKRFLSKIDVNNIMDISYDKNGVPEVSTGDYKVKFNQCKSKLFMDANKNLEESSYYENIFVRNGLLVVTTRDVNKIKYSQQAIESAFSSSLECVSKKWSNKNLNSWDS